MRRLVPGLLLGIGLGGCAAPALHSYVLGTTTPAVSLGVEALPADVIELRPVLLPDDLDTSAILRRQGQELVASRNGRWAARLSVGIRQAVAADLQALRPQAAVVTASPLQADFRRVSLTVGGFTLEGGVLTLEASWLVEAMQPVRTLARRRARLAAAVGPGDAAQVAAMSLLLDRLAAAMARDL